MLLGMIRAGMVSGEVVEQVSAGSVEVESEF